MMMNIYVKFLFVLALLKHINYVSTKEIAESLNMSPDEMKLRCDKLFELIDKNADGILQHDELIAFYDRINLVLTERHISSELAQIDSNGDNVVSFDELIATIEKTSEIDNTKHIDSLKKRFNAADKDGNGNLDAIELSLLINPGKDEVLREIDLQEVLENHDLNKDGKISLDEFKESSGQDVATSESEFSFIDTDGDGFIDENEIRQIYHDESADSLDNLDEFLSNFESKDITKQLWDENLDDVAISSITDFGEVLRHPKYYHLDIGENILHEVHVEEL